MFSAYPQSDLKFSDHNTSSNAEPMTLGSPVSSPKSKTNASQNYLPPYLFGEFTPSPIGTVALNSPKLQNSVFSTSYSSTPTSQFREPIFQSPVSSSIINTPNAAKSSGPPIQGLLFSSISPTSFDVSHLDGTPKTPRLAASSAHNASGILTPSKSFSLNNSTFMSPAQVDPFYTQGEALKNTEQLDESWVTVFGFPSASASYILQQFSQYGNIVEHKILPNVNWMHIRYQSKLQAKKALSKNGKVFSGNIMIGVKPCIEIDLMDYAKENSVCGASNASVTSPLNDSYCRAENSEATKPSIKNMRPLTQAFLSPKTPQSVTPKSGGIVSKAIDYFLKY